MKRASPLLHSMANFGTRRRQRASRRLPYGGAEVLGAPLRGETRKRRAVVGLACLIDRFVARRSASEALESFPMGSHAR